MTNSEAMKLALQHHQAGRLREAEVIYRQILASEPNHVDATHYLGVLAIQANRPDVALPLLDAAVAKDGSRADYRANRGLALANLGRRDEAIAEYRRAVELKPSMPENYVNLGSALCDRGEYEQAIAACNEALRYRPDYAEALNTLGNALLGSGHVDPALVAMRRAVTVKPDYAEAFCNLGNALRVKGRHADAIGACQRAISLRPGFPEAYNNLGNALRELGRYDDAVGAYKQALAGKPDYSQACGNLGIALFDQGRLDDSVAVLRRAVAMAPENVLALNSLGNVLQERGELDESRATFTQALNIRPDYAEAHNNLAHVLKDAGLIGEALACYDRSLKLRPDDAVVRSNRIYTMHFHSGSDAAGINAALKDFNHRFKRDPAQHTNDPTPGRRLRIGYVSPYFRNHVVGWNLLPILEKHDRSQVEIFCYSDVRRGSDFTEKIRAQADAWRPIMGSRDEQVAALIQRDRIDILVDLTVHMADNRLLMFAGKPAPVQVTYLGYCGSTGLEAVDYRLSDPHLDPPETDGQYVEKTVRLPVSYWCYGPGGATPEVSELPEGVTFSCLNNYAKVSDATLETWSEILRAAPGSKLLLHCQPGSHRQAISDRFGSAVTFVPMQNWDNYIRTHGRASIALDPFPYNGGITTCDALWMGVPVVTLSGAMPVGRAGRTLLNQVGLTELIAQSREEYVRLAVELANDRGRLGELRRTLRERLRASPLMDAAARARDLEAAYRQMWTNWARR